RPEPAGDRVVLPFAHDHRQAIHLRQRPLDQVAMTLVRWAQLPDDQAVLPATHVPASATTVPLPLLINPSPWLSRMARHSAIPRRHIPRKMAYSAAVSGKPRDR